MRWQKAARLVVAAVGLGTAVAIYVWTRERPDSARPPAAVGDPAASIQTGGGRDLRFDEQSRLKADLTYASQRAYDDGRIVYEQLRLALENGTVVTAKLVEASGRTPGTNMPPDWSLKGDVRFTSGDETSLAGESATYNHTSGTATIPGPVTFSKGSIRGTGNGGTYERDTGAFKLLADVEVRVAGGADGAEPIDVTSETMMFLAAGRSMLFDGSARIARTRETMMADRATLYLGENEQNVRVIELRGSASVAPLPGQTSDLPEMRASDIDLSFHEGAQTLERGTLMTNASLVLTNAEGRRSIAAPRITFTTATDGKTLTRLEAGERVTVKTPASRGTPERTITAITLVATGGERTGLTAAVFDGSVEFIELVPSANGREPRRREGTSQSLALRIRGNLDTIDEATFQRNVKFSDGGITGDADIGIYRAAAGELELQPFARNPQRRPHVDDGDVTVDATEIIKIALDSHDLFARRDVKTTRPAEAGQRDSSVGLFNRGEVWYGSAAEFQYTAATKTLRYTGTQDVPARLRQGQGDTIVTAREINLAEERQDLTAQGNVETVFMMAPRSGATPTEHRVTSAALTYLESARTATYTGAPAVLRTPDSETRAATIVLVMAATARRLESLDATGNVVVTQTKGGRSASGHRLRYDASKDQYTLEGTPVTLQMTNTDGTCSIAKGNQAIFVGATGTPDFPAEGNPGASTNTRVAEPCRSLVAP